MGYNANKELEVTISNALSAESETYVGINQFSCTGLKYPRIEKRPPKLPAPESKGSGSNGLERKPQKVSPSSEAHDKFIKWVQATIVFVERKVDNHPTPQMLISQILDEIRSLLKKDPKSESASIYTKLNVLIWNASSRGLLTQSEFNDLINHLTGFESELFRIG